MKKTSSKIVFFGSGPVAAESLKLLLNDFEVEAVVTKPTTEKEMSVVAGNIPVLTVQNKSELDNLVEAKQFESNLGILIDFGIIVSRKVIDSFELGILNSHFSILPEWRGADPINFAILSGQRVTGVSLMMLVEAMDEGPLLSYQELALSGSETSSELTKKLVNLSYDLLIRDVPKLVNRTTKADTPQSATKRAISYSRKLTKEDGILDFNKPAKQLEAEIRAFSDWPKSRTEIAGKDIVVLKAHVDKTENGPVGQIFKTEDKKLGIYTSNGCLIIEELKPAGKNAMLSSAFLAGYGSNL